MVAADLNHPCPICPKKFPGRRALNAHIGTTNFVSASAHLCTLCKQRFCSENALKQHQRAPSHDTMFKCNKCEATFRGQEALEQHRRAKRHGNSKSSADPILTANPISVKPEESRHQSSSGGTTMMTAVEWKVNGNTGQMMNMQLDEDWALCDKDCGWCGHCVESYTY
jgi:hypothetical protein